jgi:uncharacterized membrane protein
MAPFTNSIEIDRSPDDVYAYLDDLARHGEWQDGLVSVKVEGDGPTKLGTRATEVRRFGKREMTMTYEITEHDPPRVFGFRGLDGPIRPIGHGTVESLDNGKRSRVTVSLELTGHGFGKLLLPLATSQAKKEVPKNQQRLKERLEAGA